MGLPEDPLEIHRRDLGPGPRMAFGPVTNCWPSVKTFGGRAKAIGHDDQQTVHSLQAAFFAPEVSADADFCSSVLDEVDCEEAVACDEPEVSIGI